MKTLTLSILVCAMLALMGCGDEYTYGDTITNNYYTAPSSSAPEPGPDANPAADAGTDAKADSKPETDAKADSLPPDAKSDSEADAKADSPEPDAQPDSETEAGQDAATESGEDAPAEAQADAQAEAEADAADAQVKPTVLTIEYAGNVPTNLPAGGLAQTTFRVTLCTTKLLEITERSYSLRPLTTGRTQGTNNTPYFFNFKETYQGHPVSGPGSLKVMPGETMPSTYNPIDTFQMPAGTCQTLEIKSDLAQGEDAAGEFIEQNYAMAIYGIGAKVLQQPGEPQDRFIDNTEVKWYKNSGDSFKVKPCNPGTKLACDCNGTFGWTNCGVNYEPLQCVCPQQGMEAHLDSLQPETDIVIGEKDLWYSFARYNVASSENMAMPLSRGRIRQTNPNGTWKDAQQIALAMEGTVVATCTFDQDGDAVCDQWTTPVNIQPGAQINIEVWVKMAKVEPPELSSWLAAAHSGHTPAFRLVSLEAFDHDYYAVIKDEATNPMVLRATKPIIIGQVLTNSILVPGEMNLYCDQLNSDAQAPTYYKQLSYDVNYAPGTNVTVSGYKVYRNSSLMPDSWYTVTDRFTGDDLRTIPKTAWHKPVLTFTSQMVESNSGSVYCLRANIAKNTIGNALIVSPDENEYQSVATGYLLNNDGYAPYPANANIYNVGEEPTQQLAGWHVNGDTVWSDGSSLYHSYLPKASKDWMDGYLVPRAKMKNILADN